MIKKLIREHFRTIKIQLKKGVTLFLICLIVFLIFPKIVFADTILIEDFENYNFGILGGQGGWIAREVTPQFRVVIDDKHSGLKSIYYANHFADNAQVKKTGTSIADGNITFWWKIVEETIENDFIFALGETIDDFNIWFRVLYEPSTENINTYYWSGTYYYLISSGVATSTWNFTQIEWRNSDDKVRFKTNDDVWTNWVDTALPFDTIGNVLIASWIEVYIDDISYTFGNCGTDNYLRFCYTENECITNGGYWVADFCWKIPPPETLNWDEYYLEHSQFTTPTTMIVSLVNLISPSLESAGGWLVALEDIFNVAKAGEKGEEFGEAIPIARGYLQIINDFFGGLPLSEAFVFFIVIMLGIGVFRIVRNIISLIKP